MLPPAGATPELQRIENAERAIGRLIGRVGGPEGLAVPYEAGPCGYGLLRLLGRLGVACDVIAPSLVHASIDTTAGAYTGAPTLDELTAALAFFRYGGAPASTPEIPVEAPSGFEPE